jgi:polyhydroxyalkanoate synthase
MADTSEIAVGHAPFEIVDEGRLLRLRHYPPAGGTTSAAPVLLVYSLLRRPDIVDLLPERSLVRNLTEQGFSVYLTDWQPPTAADADCGLDVYINHDLARAVDTIRVRENVPRVSLVGCCLGGLLATIYTALHPERVLHLVTSASPFEMRPPIPGEMLEALVSLYGNLPAWWIHAALSARVPTPLHFALYVAQDLGESDLNPWRLSAPPLVQVALLQWSHRNVAVAGRVFCEIMRDVYERRRLATGNLVVGDRHVKLDQIRCPVLNIAGERDQLVPPASTAALVEHVGSGEASNLVFATGHLGLLVGLKAHDELWPRVGVWLKSRVGSRNCGLDAAEIAAAFPVEDRVALQPAA